MTTDRYKKLRRLIVGGGHEAKLFRLIVEEGWRVRRVPGPASRPTGWHLDGRSDLLPDGQRRAAEALYDNRVIVGDDHLRVAADAALVYLREARPPFDLPDSGHVLVAYTHTAEYESRPWHSGNVYAHTIHYAHAAVLVPATRLRAVVQWAARVDALPADGRDRIRTAYLNLFGGFPTYYGHVHCMALRLRERATTDPAAAVHVHQPAAGPLRVAAVPGFVPSWAAAVENWRFEPGQVHRLDAEPACPGVYKSPAEALADWGVWTAFNQLAALG